MDSIIGKITLGFVSWLVLLPCLTPAQETNPDRPLLFTWEDCVATALKNNPDLASSSRALEAGKASYRGSFNGLLPQLNLSNSYSDSDSFGGNGGFHWQAQGTASLDLWNAGQIASIKSASAEVRQAQANLRQASSTLRLNLRKAFAQLLFAQKNVEVSKKILEMRQRSSQLVTLRYDSGRESKGNRLRSRAQFLQAQADYSQALRDLRTAQKSLDRQLGLDEFSMVIATGTLDANPLPDFPTNPKDLLSSRPDIAAQQAVIQNAQASLAQSYSTLWPKLSASYSRSILGTKEFPSSRYGWSLSGVLSYPLFGGGPTATIFAVSASKKKLEKAEQDLRSVRNQAILELESSWSSFAGTVDQVKVQDSLLEAARQRNDEADIRYANGLLSYDNWEIIASDRINSERQSIQTQLNSVNAEAAWKKALGVGLDLH